MTLDTVFLQFDWLKSGQITQHCPPSPLIILSTFSLLQQVLHGPTEDRVDTGEDFLSSSFFRHVHYSIRQKICKHGKLHIQLLSKLLYEGSFSCESLKNYDAISFSFCSPSYLAPDWGNKALTFMHHPRKLRLYKKWGFVFFLCGLSNPVSKNIVITILASFTLHSNVGSTG